MGNRSMYDRIEYLCKKEGSNVTQMCLDLKIHRANLCNLKSWQTKCPSADAVLRIARYFGVSPYYIVYGDDDACVVRREVTEDPLIRRLSPDHRELVLALIRVLENT